ncbi:MAG: mechanosensitive ion channel family protein [Euryarchaeota archaeon]|jgi:small-conductance mechanosensitive channel|nr:mechanosensitive ion channel family protein [Euryarchaeota archaeon]MBT5593795.1 mechanosensitive ion channel family protein [Euryarchaeota archaeon]
MDIQGFIDDVDALNDYFRIAIAIGMILFGLLVAKYLVIRPWWKFVTATEVDWDDHLHRPLANRTYAFIIALGVQLTIRWILGTEGATFDTTEPMFAAFYVVLSASILSVSIKHLIPVLMDRFSAQGSVTVSGSNSIIVFFLRTVVWFAGLYFALDQLGIELFGILASLAVFSLIIGLAVQQTLGNIVNSFLLSIDRPFEVGDRIEVEEVLGSVVSVGILSTKVLDRDERLVVIPNNTLVQSKIVNHARGGGDGIARRISVVLDVGVDYREDIDHVKYTLLQLAKECPFVIDRPEPRILLNELGDFAKVFRMYTWVEDYSDEWVAKDWLLRNVDERFGKENINIPFPTSVELSDSVYTQAEATTQRTAKRKMQRERRKLQESRDGARTELDELAEALKDPDMSKKDRNAMEERQRELLNLLAMFDTDDD